MNNMFNYLPAACHFGVEPSAFSSWVQQLKYHLRMPSPPSLPAWKWLGFVFPRSPQSLVTSPFAAMAALGQVSYRWTMSAYWMRTSPSR